MPACSGRTKSGGPSTYLTETTEMPKSRITQVASSGSVIVVAWGLACLQALLDLVARKARISAEPALISLQIAVIVSALLLWSLVARHLENRGLDEATSRPVWRLCLSLVSLLCCIALRIVISPIEPSVMWLAPALLVAPVLLGFELLSFCRTGARMSRVFMERLAATWSGIAAVLILAIAAGPLTWAQVHVRAVELHFVALSVVLTAGSAALSAASRRHWSGSIRFVFIATAAAFAGLWTSTVDNSFTRIWPTFVAVLVILFALAIPGGAIGSAAAATKIWAGHGVRITRSSATRAQHGVGRAARACIGLWHRLELFASSPQPRSRPLLTRSDRIGATVMAFLAMAYVASGAI